ncbi:MAG: aspartate kinase [Bdellovibrionota bacterium]
MNLIVQKYGGSSVATSSQIEAIARHIKQGKEQGQQTIAVISAMGQQTDDLLRLAYEIYSTPPRRELDMLLTAGERISMALLAIALKKIGVESISLTGSQCGILTDGTHGNARITSILGNRIREGLAQDKVVIIAGFQGVNPDSKEVTTLGRGGTDLTAIAIASSLQAKSCQLYKDVKGIMTSDPRFVKNAKLISQIDWSSMSELAWSGAGVLHHRSAHLAEKFAIEVEIRESANPNNVGTLIKGKEMETPSVIAITHRERQLLLTLSFKMQDLASHSILSDILQILWQLGEAPSISRLSRDVATSADVEIVIASSVKEELMEQLKKLHPSCQIKREVADLACINIIGSGFRQHPEVLSKICDLIPQNALIVEVHHNNICFAIADKFLEETLVILHQELFE